MSAEAIPEGDRPCAMCTHVHPVTYDTDLRVFLCDDCLGYVEDDDDWGTTEMCVL